MSTVDTATPRPRLELAVAGYALQPGQGARAVSTKVRRFLLENPGLLRAGLSRRAREHQ